MPFKRDKLGRLIYVRFPKSISRQKIEKVLEQAQPTQKLVDLYNKFRNISIIVEG
jgi:hypothetical protein